MSTKYGGARFRRVGRGISAGALLVLMAACDREPQETEIQWARAALERNPHLDVVAADPNEGVFTVRMRDTGEVRVVSLGELAAAPVAQLDALAIAQAEPQRRAAQPEQPATQEPAAQPEDAPAEPEPQRAAETESAEPAPEAPTYTIERSGDQVRVSGPGVSIVSSGTPSAGEQSGEQGPRSTDPIICEGRRMLHFDNRNIYVDGDAIVARGGCELYITNSRIGAAGTGVVVQDAVVHIANSVIEGNSASFSAGDSARMYLRSSTFHGVPRRSEKAVIQDQGGNRWR